MKINEAIQMPLFESFGQLKTALENFYTTTTGRPNIKRAFIDLNDAVREAINASSDFPSDPKGGLTASSTLEIIRFLIKDPRGFKEFPQLNNTGTWIKQINHFLDIGNEEAVPMALQMHIKNFVGVATDPSKQKPKINQIKKTDKFHIIEMENYAAARDICNKFNLNWCIGSSTSSWFEDYGKRMGRKSYAVSFSDKSILSVHMGSGGFLFTDHNNKHEYKNNGGGRGTGLRGIIAQAKKSGMELEDFMDMVEYIANDSMGQPWIGFINDDIDELWDKEDRMSPMNIGLELLLWESDDTRAEANGEVLGISKVVGNKTVSYAFLLPPGGGDGMHFEVLHLESGKTNQIDITDAGSLPLHNAMDHMNLTTTDTIIIRNKIRNSPYKEEFIKLMDEMVDLI